MWSLEWDLTRSFLTLQVVIGKSPQMGICTKPMGAWKRCPVGKIFIILCDITVEDVVRQASIRGMHVGWVNSLAGKGVSVS